MLKLIAPPPKETPLTDGGGRIQIPWLAWLSSVTSTGDVVEDLSVAITGALLAANNLSDLLDRAAARINLGLGTAAVADVTAFDAAGTAAAVLLSSLQKSANLSDLLSAVTARSNLGLGSAAVLASTAFDAAGAAAAAQAAAIAASDTAGAAAAVLASSLQKTANLSDVLNAGTARTNLGLGSAATQASSAFDAAGAAAAAQAAAIAASLPASTVLAANEPAVTHQFLTAYNSVSGAFAQAQPAAADVSGLAASATTDTTNAANIGSGTLPAGRLPNPSASTLGGVESIAAVASKWINTISTSGVPSATQPAAGDVSGLAASATTDTTNATNIGSGTLADARLSSNVPLKNAANTFSAAQTVNATSGPGLQLTTTTADSLARVSNDGTASFKATLQLYRSATDYGEMTFWPGGSGLRINNARGDASTSIQFQQQGTTKVTIAGSTGALLVNTTTDNTVDKLQVSGHIATVTAGNGYKCKEGSNARMGTATLTAGAVTISNTSVTASTRIFVTNTGGGANVGALYVSARSAGTSFTVTSTNALDTSTLNWFLVEPS